MIYPTQLEEEFTTEERCHIIEIMNNNDVVNLSIAQARVTPGQTTQWHVLAADEYYYLLEGEGIVELGDSFKGKVVPGDVVRIKAGVAQRITNTSSSDLIFLCICTPRFRPELYTSLE